MGFYKPYNERKEFCISGVVSFDIYKQVAEIALNEGTSKSEIVRKLIKKGLDEYERERK